MRAMKGVAIALVAACGFAPGVPATPGAAQIIDDTAADFAAGTLDDIAIDPLGLLAPDAYIAGGLHARGFVTTPVGPTTSYTDLTPAVLGAQFGVRYREPPIIDWVGVYPFALGLVSGVLYSYVLD